MGYLVINHSSHILFWFIAGYPISLRLNRCNNRLSQDWSYRLKKYGMELVFYVRYLNVLPCMNPSRTLQHMEQMMVSQYESCLSHKNKMKSRKNTYRFQQVPVLDEETYNAKYGKWCLQVHEATQTLKITLKRRSFVEQTIVNRHESYKTSLYSVLKIVLCTNSSKSTSCQNYLQKVIVSLVILIKSLVLRVKCCAIRTKYKCTYNTLYTGIVPYILFCTGRGTRHIM